MPIFNASADSGLKCTSDCTNIAVDHEASDDPDGRPLLLRPAGVK